MKKIITFIIIILSIGGIFNWYKFIYLKNYIPTLETEKTEAIIEKYYIYGTNLSLFGRLDKVDATYKKVDLILYNGKTKSYKIKVNRNTNKLTFSLDEEINKGIYLDEIKKGNYTMFLRFAYDKEVDVKAKKKKDGKEEYNYKYYILKNDTDYKTTTYYTMSKSNKKIIINSDNNYNTLMINVEDNTNKNKYDIVIDPGHGGIDSGALSNNQKYTEAELCMKAAILLKNKIEKAGYSVKLTREEDSLTEKDYFDEYNKHGRAVIAREVGAKYLFSIHMNSSSSTSVRGFELYTASDIDYTLAEYIAESIIDNTEMIPSTNKINREDTGIYTHNFSEYEISRALEGYKTKGYKPYKVTENSNYLYMIRETGGFMTGAYVDDSNPESVGVNKYYNSNIGTESYLLEMGYLTNTTDLDILVNKQEEYTDAIAKGIIDYLKNNKKSNTN